MRSAVRMRSTDVVTNPAYDEFGLFHQNAEEFGIALAQPPVVERVSVEVGGVIWKTPISASCKLAMLRLPCAAICSARARASFVASASISIFASAACV